MPQRVAIIRGQSHKLGSKIDPPRKKCMPSAIRSCLSLFPLLGLLLLISGTVRAMSGVFITRATKIINIGHLPGHVAGKVELLRQAGFGNAVGIVTLQTTKEAIKSELRDSPGALFIVGGAMNKEYPELMAELNEFIRVEAPTVLVHNTSKDDFPPGCAMPPTEAIVAASAVTIANRLLREEAL